MTATLTPPTRFSPAANMPADEVSAKIEKARRAAAVWRRYSITERVDIVRALFKELRSRSNALVNIVHDETGKPAAEVLNMEFGTLEMILKYFTRNAHRILQDQAAWRPWLLFNKRAYVHYVPRGVIGVITPWNLPLVIPCGDILCALLAGNAVVNKPSEWTSRTALLVESIVRDSGLLPEGLWTVVAGDGKVGQQVIAQTDMILFTGSTRGGKAVAEACAKELKPCVLELGGKHPMIVFKDAALNRAVKAAVWGGFANCGQLCVGVERIYVENELYDAFTDALRKETAALRQGLEGEADVGRLIFPPQLDHVQSQLQDARQKGARVIGGDVLDAANLLMKPALVLEATPEMRVMTEETFGPVLPVMRVDKGEEAVRLSNRGSLGLSASVWTKDLAKAERVAQSIEAGMVGINDLMSHYAVCSLPFSGIKHSGLGRRHSEEGLRMFCYPQAVLAHEWPADVPELWWFPYQKAKNKLVSWMVRLS